MVWQMGTWVFAGVGLLVVGILARRVYGRRNARIDIGEVSQTWIVEHRASKTPSD